MQHKLRPFWGVWQVTRKDAAAECKSTLDLLPEDPSLSCFGEGKLTQRSKRHGYRFFFFFVQCRFPGFLSAMSNTATWPHAVQWHESLPDHFRPCPQNTWAPYYTAACDWLKPMGVSALTDRSGVIYCIEALLDNSVHCWQVSSPPEKGTSSLWLLFALCNSNWKGEMHIDKQDFIGCLIYHNVLWKWSRSNFLPTSGIVVQHSQYS